MMNDEYNKIKEENEQMKKEMEEISNVPKNEHYERLFEIFNNLKDENKKLKKENEIFLNKLNLQNGSDNGNSQNIGKNEEIHNKELDKLNKRSNSNIFIY